MDPAATSWLGLALLLGLVHALDADHVMALSIFATRERGASDGVRAGVRWALGHGSVLLAVGGGMLLLGASLPPEVSAWAERAVGFTMIGLGAWVFFDLSRRRQHLHFHRHDGLPAHAHWHGHGAAATDAARTHRHAHGAVMVGALHGLAGSAPLLAILPIASSAPLAALACLVVFCVGVMLAMAVLSGLLGHLAGRLSDRGSGSLQLSALRAVGAMGTVLLGGWLVAAG